MLDKYQIIEEIFSNEKTIINRAFYKVDSKPVIIKTFARAYPSIEDVVVFKHEYDIVEGLTLSGVIKIFSYEEDDSNIALIMEDDSGVSLSSFLKENTIDLVSFLKMAVSLADTLAEIHQKGVIHKDIKPGNIIVIPPYPPYAASGEANVKITDFGIATKLSKENFNIANPNTLQGTLSYLSPEQTGRMNRSVDYRTDIYSLGVTFYQIVTGLLPFISNDVMEIVYSHIARVAEPPDSVNPNVPGMLSKIIMKMMAKRAEDRYQSCYGLKYDLETCLHEYLKNGDWPELEIATRDRSTNFQIPEKLYGRDTELQNLLTTFQDVVSGSVENVFITGLSGIGKTAFVGELKAPITKTRGFYIFGKFDQYKKNVPFNAIIQAFSGLVKEILSESNDKILEWKQKILTAVGENGKILTDVLPDLELVLGKQEEIVSLGLTESQVRFRLTFMEFVKCFSQKNHPLTIFIDDLQWADTASLSFIQSLLFEPRMESLFFIGAFRDNEVEPTHSLNDLLDALKQAKRYNEVNLQALKKEDIVSLLSDALQQEEGINNLAEIVYTKTNGNPFFVGEFLKNLYSKNLLYYDYNSYRWIFEENQVRTLDFSDNVVTFMIEKIREVSDTALPILQIASCIGNQFALFDLSVIAQTDMNAITGQLEELLDRGLLLPLDDKYNYAKDLDSKHQQNLQYRFLHDRIQQAAYNTISEEERIALHLKIGYLLEERLSEAEKKDKIFSLVEHFNTAGDLLKTSEEKRRVANYNLLAATKAKASSAFQEASKYLRIAIELLGEQKWQNSYELAIALHIELVESLFLKAAYSDMEAYAQDALAHCNNLHEKVRIYEVLIQAHNSRLQYKEAVLLGIDVIQLLGDSLPKNANKLHVVSQLALTKIALANKDPKHLLDLPEMTDPIALSMMRTFMTMSSAAYFVMPDLFPVLVFKMVRLSIKYGNAKLSSFAYVCYGLAMCAVLGDFTDGFKFGSLALDIMEKYHAEEVKAKTFFLYNLFIHHWKKSIFETLPGFQEGRRSGYSTGDLEYASHCTFWNHTTQYFVGQTRLPEVEKETLESLELLQSQGQVKGHLLCTLLYLNLYTLSGNEFSEKVSYQTDEKIFTLLQEGNDNTSLSYLFGFRVILRYFQKDYPGVVQAAKAIDKKYYDSIMGQSFVPVYKFYEALARIELCKEKSGVGYAIPMQKIKFILSKFKKWASHSPENYKHKYLFLKAQIAAYYKEFSNAIKYFDQAIQLASKNNFRNDVALMSEIAGEFYLSMENSKIASVFLMDSYYAYIQWGAKALAQTLKEKHSNLLIRANESDSSSLEKTINSGSLSTYSFGTKTNTVKLMDYMSVVKAARAISGEMNLDSLLQRSIEIIVENAGATRGFYIIYDKSSPLLKVNAENEEEVVVYTPARPLVKEEHLLSTTIVNYVYRTKKSLVLNDVQKKGDYTADAYVLANTPLSVLCMPILQKNQVNGILYLENNYTTDAFTPQRLEVLDVLCSQAAISLDNANLYTHVMNLNKSYERFVPEEFLQFLGKDSIVDVELGDHLQKEMTVLFSDIRSFTSLSESMSPEDNFRFINSYLSRVGPIIRENNGFIDKYIGDAIMALFALSPEDGLRASIDMQLEIIKYNIHRKGQGFQPISIGIGLHTGMLMLGTIGESERMEGTVISDAVNLASRVEGLTKMYGASIIITDSIFRKIADPDVYFYRVLDRVIVKGKKEAVQVIEILNGQAEKRIDLFMETRQEFEMAINAYLLQEFAMAKELLEKVLQKNQNDKAAGLYLQRVEYYIEHGTPLDWQGVETMDSK
ncbi:MAG: AAA family ATPase [Spirochaetota bacterium]